jgi:triphosphatase
MTDTGELELRFRLDASARKSLADDGFTAERATSRARLRSTYFDTPNGDLAHARISLHVRHTPAGLVQTVKTETGIPFERFEWEQPIPHASPRIDALPPADSQVGATVRQHFDRLKPLFVTDFERIAWRRDIGRSLGVDVVCDQGSVRAGEQSLPLAEIEIERLAGERRAFYRWVKAFAQRHRLSISIPNKNERGLRLIGRLPAIPPPARATLASMKGSTSVSVAASIATRSCLWHLTANIEPLMNGDDPGATHQMRVALRRLRAAIRLFELGSRDPRWTLVGASAGHLADVVGRLREADVFEAGVLAKLRAAFADDEALDMLARGVARVKLNERVSARAAVADLGFTRLVLSAAYLSELLAAGSRGPESTLEDFARIRIAELWTKMRKRLRRAADPAGWHRARIATKNLRYGLEFVATALSKPKRLRDAIECLATLQERLGAEQDRATSLAVARLAADAAPAKDATHSVRALALIEGWNSREIEKSGGLRDAAQRSLANLKRDLHEFVRTETIEAGENAETNRAAPAPPSGDEPGHR